MSAAEPSVRTGRRLKVQQPSPLSFERELSVALEANRKDDPYGNTAAISAQGEDSALGPALRPPVRHASADAGTEA